jgi:phage terminase large subunit-like protein
VVGEVPRPVLLTPGPVNRLSMTELAVQAQALIRRVDADRYDWPRHARPSQREPRNYFVWGMVGGTGMGKAVHVDTPIPVYRGSMSLDLDTAVPGGAFTRMGDLAVGDRVFDESGRPCTVTATFDRTPAAAYRVRFSDGTWIDACDEHQWVTWTRAERRAYLRSAHEADVTRFPAEWPAWRVRRRPKSKAGLPRPVVERALELAAEGLSARTIGSELGTDRKALSPHLSARTYLPPAAPLLVAGDLGPQIRTTQQIADTLTTDSRGSLNHCVPTCGPMQLPEAVLPVDPWVLGYWLGNGHRRSGSMTTDSRDEPDVRNLLAAAGWDCSHRYGADDHNPGASTFTVYGLSPDLRKLGVLEDKHVPDVYLWASQGQREALLAGLVDSDGHCDAQQGGVEFSSTQRNLADAVLHLARSLGEKPTLAEGRAMLGGVDHGPKFRVTWRPTTNPFRLSRKAARVRPGGAQSLRNHHRMITAVEPIPPAPMRCITVDSPHSMYLVGEGLIPTHNSRTGAETVRRWAKRRVGTYAVIAKNDREVRRICFEAPRAGLLAVIPPEDVAGYKKGAGETELTLTNGSRIMAFSAETPDNLRGYAFDGIWLDELAAFSKTTAQDTWDVAMFRLREAVDPHVIVTTTPKNVPHIKALMAKLGTEPGWVLTRGHTQENRANLSPQMLAELERAYAGTRLGRQELGGELLEDVEGALWTLELIAAATWRTEAYGPLPDLVEVVTSVDPSGSETGDATGIVTLARARPRTAEGLGTVTSIATGQPPEGGPIIVLADASTKGTPEHRYSTACLEAYRHSAGVILMENAYGGDNVFMGIRSSWADLVRREIIDPSVPVPRLVVAPTKGKSKADRAQPVVGLYEQTAGGAERIFHAGMLAELEDEQTTWEPASKWSPNRLDALVHGVRHLMRMAGYTGAVGSATGLQPRAHAGSRRRR